MAKRRKAYQKRPRSRTVRSSRWQAVPGVVQHGVCFTLLVAVALTFWSPALFSGKTLIGGDIVQWRAAAESMIQYRAETGEEPLWATNVFAGMPGYVISPPAKVPQIDIIPNTLRAFSWPVSHFIFLLLGAYSLVFYLSRDKVAGLLTAVAYGLTTYLPVILVAGHNTKFVALCYAPWLVLAFAHTLRRPGLLSGLLFAVALAVNLRAAHVQITYYVTFTLVTWWIAEGIGAMRNGETRRFLTATAFLVFGSLMALCMAAESYLLTWEYKPHSIRGASSGGAPGGLEWAYAMSWSQGIAEIVTLVIADAFGGASMYWGPKPFTGGPHYVGAVVLLLAIIAVWRLRKPAVIALGIAAVFMTLFSFGRHFETLNRFMFEYFPLFDAFRVPETWLIAVAFVLAVLAGYGLSSVLGVDRSPRAEIVRGRSIFIATGAAICIVGVLFLGGDSLFRFERSGEFETVRQQIALQMELPETDQRVMSTTDRLFSERVVAPRRRAFKSDAARSLIFLVLAALVFILFRRKLISPWTVQMVLVILIGVDLWGVGRRYFNEDRLVRASDPASLVQTLDVDQYLLNRKKASGGEGSFRVLSLEQNDQTKNGRPSYHHESLGGYSGAKLRLYQDFLENILIDPSTRLPNDNALDMLNVRYVIARGSIPGMEVVFRGDETGLAVLENPDPLNRATLVGETELIPSADETWERLQSRAFDPRRTVILHEPLDGFEPAPLDSISTAIVDKRRYGPREMAWEVTTDLPRLLVISEVFYPAGWTATVGGEEVPIHRGNYLLRALEVPAGTHEVVLRFDPPAYTSGRLLGHISTVLVYGGILSLLGLAWFRRRRPWRRG